MKFNINIAKQHENEPSESRATDQGSGIDQIQLTVTLNNSQVTVHIEIGFSAEYGNTEEKRQPVTYRCSPERLVPADSTKGPYYRTPSSKSRSEADDPLDSEQ